MKTQLKKLAIGLALAGMAASANATMISMQMGGGNPYWDDYDVTFGLGSTSAPDWSVQVARSHNGGDFGGSASYDITSLFNAAANQTWWVFVDDNWGANVSNLTSFTIDTGSVVYASADTPIYIPDNGQAYAFIAVEGSTGGTVPEPATLALFGLGLAGLGFSRRKQA